MVVLNNNAITTFQWTYVRKYTFISLCLAVNVQWSHCPSDGTLILSTIILKHAIITVCEK